MEQMQMNMPDIYDAALYLRLSKDDMEEGGAKSESNSIANQRELLRSFVKSQPDIQIFDIYVDDGYSGGNFDRPEFNSRRCRASSLREGAFDRMENVPVLPETLWFRQ